MAAEVVVIVENQDARVFSNALTIEVRCGQSRYPSSNNYEVVRNFERPWMGAAQSGESRGIVSGNGIQGRSRRDHVLTRQELQWSHASASSKSEGGAL